MSIISKETFNKFSEAEKKSIQTDYQDLLSDNGRWIDNLTSEERSGAIMQLEWMFGRKNLQPELEIKTWADVAIHKSEIWDEIHKVITTISGCSRIGNKLLNKLIATIQLQKLIELGYGGTVSDEEWEDISVTKYVIEPIPSNKKKFFINKKAGSYYNYIAFHTKQQAEKFMSYPENIKLIEQYYLI